MQLQKTEPEMPLTSLGSKNKGKKNGERKIFNVKSVLELKYDLIDLGEEFSSLIGLPESKFTGMIYGEPGSGKSVFTLKLAERFSKLFGKVLYGTYEERTNKTLQDRIRQFNISSPKLYFGVDLTFDELVKKIKANHYKLVVIDSLKYAAFTFAQLQELRRLFKKRKLVIIMVSYGSAEGNPDGAKDHLGACDIKLYFKKGKVKSHGRYIQQPIEKVLFHSKTQKDNTALDL